MCTRLALTQSDRISLYNLEEVQFISPVEAQVASDLWPAQAPRRPRTREDHDGTSQDHNEDLCGPVYASETTGICFLLESEDTPLAIPPLAFSRGGFNEAQQTQYQPVGAASDRATTT